jgi:hypothetical protein
MSVGIFLLRGIDMKIRQEAIDRAKEKEMDEKNLRLCLNQLVCPNCSNDLKRELVNLRSDTYKLVCYHCKHEFNAEVPFRELI